MKNLKKLMLMPILIISFAVCVPMLYAQDSVSPTISVEDAQTFRKIIADRDYWKARADELERQKDEWQRSAANWEKLYNSEKYRADVVQEQRITELREANKSLTSANFQLREQATADRQRLGEQQFTINKLKQSRKWYFATGLGVGFGAGVFTGYQVKAKFSF